jgi:hypothetical protein
MDLPRGEYTNMSYFPNASIGVTGSAFPIYSTLVGGSDGTNLRALLTDSSGQLKVLVENFPGTQPISGTVVVSSITGPLPAGTNVIGHVITDTGSTTAVTGTVAVTQSTSPWVDNLTQWASTALGVPTNFGTTPGAVIAGSVNASLFSGTTALTNTGGALNVNVTSTTITGTVAVTQSTSPWVVSLASTTVTGTVAENLTQVAGVVLGATAVTAFGTAPAAANVPGVNASIFAGTTGLTATGSSLNVNITSGGTPQTVEGDETNNAAAPEAAAALEVLPAIANAASPAWTEGFNVLQSVDLAGNQRSLTINGVMAEVTAAWTSATSGNTVLTLSTLNYASLVVAISTTSTITGGILTFEVSDTVAGTNWYAISATQINSNVNMFTVYTLVATTNIGFRVPVAGWVQFRVRLSTVISGTGTVNIGILESAGSSVSNIVGISGINTGNNIIGKIDILGNSGANLDAVITAATAPPNGLATLGVNQTTPPSLTAGQSVASQVDYVGSLFVKPYRRSQTVGQATTIASSTTATTVLAAQAAGIFADISSLIITATPALTTALVFTATLSDGTLSYVYDMDTGTIAASSGPIIISFNPPIPATTAATAWTVALSVATVTVHITTIAVLQKAS